MGIFDDMTALLGQGMDAADKKTQEFKLHNELNRLASNKEKALADLGRAVLVHEGSSPTFATTYADKIKTIGDLEAQEEGLRKRIEALQSNNTLVGSVTMQTANAVAQGHTCPTCGSPVALESMFCQACGDNLVALKTQFKKCPNCNIYYSADSMFCEKCGSKIEELEVAAVANRLPSDSAESEAGVSLDDLNTGVADVTDDVDDSKACPHCGSLLKQDAAFCSECGNQL